MKEITNWTVKRSGDHMTLDGRDAQGDIVKLAVVKVAMGDPDNPDPIATAADGTRYRLVPRFDRQGRGERQLEGAVHGH